MEGPACSYLLSAAIPRFPLQEGTYLYGIHLVLVSTDTLNEHLPPLMMTLQHLPQSFLYSEHTNSCGGHMNEQAVREKD